MADNSSFESRKGRLSCTPEVFYNFISDIRNLEQFVPEGKVANWTASADNCSFNVPPLGSATVRIASKDPYTLVEYSGEVMKSNSFKLKVSISGNENNRAVVTLYLIADLNPLLKMMAAGPISNFLEKLIYEMERNNKWE